MPSDRTLWFATSNKAKLEEARAILSEFGIHTHQLRNPKIEIQSINLGEIASFAADEISRGRSGVVAVEDSGLFVNSLAGFPGPFASYTQQTIGASGILKLLSNKDDRTAYFEAAIAVSKSGRTLKIFSGRVNGIIAKSQRGDNGFGFDPIFIPVGSLKTFGEMRGTQKNAQSHRSRALTKLAQWYSGYDK